MHLNKLSGALLFSLMLATLTSQTFAQSVEERTAALKQWRSQCSDSDPDLQLAYVEEALKQNDAAIRRICLRQTLLSDNETVVNLGLRAALANLSQLTFSTTIPSQLKAAYDKAGGNKKQLQEVSNWKISRLFEGIQNGFIFVPDEASITSETLKLFPLGSLTQVNPSYVGTATIVGATLSWQGLAQISGNNRSCRLNTTVNREGRLVGTLQCENWWPIPIDAKLI